MEQHKFIKDLDADFPNRAQLLREISQKIVASPKDSFWDGEKCPICLGGFEPEHVVVLVVGQWREPPALSRGLQ